MSMTTERYPATVTSIDDPEQRGRIRVACSGLLGDEESDLPMWIEPVLGWGMFIVPDVGEIVEIEVVTGSDEDEQYGQASIDNLDAKWVGKRYFGNEEGEAPTPVPTDFLTNYGKRRGFATPGGHVVVFDDTDGKRKISVTWNNEDNKKSYFGMDENGSIVIGTHTGHTIYMNAKDGELTIIDQHGNMYSSNSDGLKVVDKSGSLIDIKGGNMQILAQAGLTVSCADAVLEAGKMQLGGQPAIQPVIMGTLFFAAMTTWTTALTTVLGTCVPSPPAGLATFVTATATFLTQMQTAMSLKVFTQ